MDEAKKVTIHVKDASVDEVMQLCFKEQPFGYEIKENMIIIKTKQLVNYIIFPFISCIFRQFQILIGLFIGLD
jgi:methyl coenzyme M reductase subunit D